MNFRFFFVLLLFTGCASEQPSPGLSFKQQCEQLGYRPGTDLFLRCYQNAQADDTNRRVAAMGYLAAHPFYTAPHVWTPPRQPMTCVRNGNTTTCN